MNSSDLTNMPSRVGGWSYYVYSLSSVYVGRSKGLPWFSSSDLQLSVVREMYCRTKLRRPSVTPQLSLVDMRIRLLTTVKAVRIDNDSISGNRSDKSLQLTVKSRRLCCCAADDVDIVVVVQWGAVRPDASLQAGSRL